MPKPCSRAFPERLRNEPGLVLESARWYRRMDRLDEAAKTLQQPPPDLVRPAAWWRERDILVRRLLEKGKDQLAYALAAWRGLGETGAAAAEAEFLSGWIAFRRLNDPKSAYEHFSTLYASATLPASQARGAYWQARAAEAMGNQEAARHWLTVAAAHGITYYGQLAAARLDSAVHLDFPPEPRPSPQEIDAFERMELVRAARMLAEIGQDDLARLFVLQVAAAAKTPVDQKLVATLAETTDALDVAIAAAKGAGRDGVPLLAGVSSFAGGLRASRRGRAAARTGDRAPGERLRHHRRQPRRCPRRDAAIADTARDVAKSAGMPFSADRLTRTRRITSLLDRPSWVGCSTGSVGPTCSCWRRTMRVRPGSANGWIRLAIRGETPSTPSIGSN